MTIKLDTKDKKLLYELDLNSRQPVSQIAETLNLSKTAVLYRINNLQKNGIIKQFQTVIDVGKLGYISFRLFFSLQGATPAKKKEIIEFLKESGNVSWVVSIEGDFDIGALILVKTTREMNIFWKRFLDRYKNFVDERLLTIMSKVSYFSRAYLLDLKYNTYEVTVVSEPEDTGIDEKDKQILRLLVSNARIQIVDIANRVNLTPKTVADRIKELEKKKIITGYRTVFDLNKLGYQYFKAHFRIYNTTREKEERFFGYVKQHPNIIFNDEVLGGDDFEIEIQVKDLEGLRDIINDINSEFAGIIKGHKIMQYYEEHKYLIPTTQL